MLTIHNIYVSSLASNCMLFSAYSFIYKTKKDPHRLYLFCLNQKRVLQYSLVVYRAWYARVLIP